MNVVNSRAFEASLYLCKLDDAGFNPDQNKLSFFKNSVSIFYYVAACTHGGCPLDS